MSAHSPQKILHEIFGYAEFRGAQQAIVEHVVAGGDALVLMPTGGGKSLCYQLPALLRAGTGIVVSPLIALMQDQVDTLKQLGVQAAFLNSSLDAVTSREVTGRLLRGELQLLYVAPERLLMPGFLALLDQLHTTTAPSPLAGALKVRNPLRDKSRVELSEGSGERARTLARASSTPNPTACPD